MNMGSVEPERKRKKTDGSQKSKRFDEDEDYHHSLDKGNIQNAAFLFFASNISRKRWCVSICSVRN